MDILTVAKIIGALGVGIIFFALFGMFIFTSNTESKREEKVRRLSEHHLNEGMGETERELHLIYRAMAYPAGSQERQQYDDMYTAEKRQHDENSSRRIKEIVEAECPVDDETWEELRAGINPYRGGA